jgi:L-alanine-DL-glutamate epimerase-like enolase superfamily enzyme
MTTIGPGPTRHFRDSHSRRHFLKLGTLATAGLTLADLSLPLAQAANPVVAAPTRGSKDLEVVGVERWVVEVPFRDLVQRTTFGIEFPHFRRVEICRVRLGGGAIGLGEMLIYPGGQATPRRTTDAAVKRVQGHSAATVMWDDTLGAGLQMALFDAVGKALGVPVHALVGRQVRDRAALAWWASDLDPEDWASECRTAFKQGYRNIKIKGRPWRDVDAQLAAVQAAVQNTFQLHLDFTRHLPDAERAIPLLIRLQKYPNVTSYEMPIRQDKVADGKRIRAAVRLPIAHHYGNPSAEVQVREELCDAFVMVMGTLGRVLNAGAVCAAFNKPFFLQLCGTGLTAAWTLQLAAVLSHANWAAVTLHQLYADDLLAEPIRVQGGTAAIPDGPGLGIPVNLEAIERFHVKESPHTPPSSPPRLLEVRWPNGAAYYYSSRVQLEEDNRAGNLPGFVPGVQTHTRFDDGTAQWRELHAQALKAPVRQGQAGGKL